MSFDKKYKVTFQVPHACLTCSVYPQLIRPSHILPGKDQHHIRFIVLYLYLGDGLLFTYSGTKQSIHSSLCLRAPGPYV